MKRDVVVIGAGPHCLSLVVRLACHHPWDECTFDVNGNQRAFDSKEHFSAHQCSPFNLENLLVVDPAGCWLNGWKKNFETLQISHLRSTVLVHSDAFDSLSMLEYIQNNSITNLPNVFDTLHNKKKRRNRRKKTKTLNNTHNPFNEAQRKFFTIPTSQVFLDHAKWLIDKHSLHDIVQKDTATKIEYVRGEEYPMKVHMASGETVEAKNVVYAGNQSVNTIPRWAPRCHPKIFHSSCINRLEECLNGSKQKILVVGGGLSAIGAALAAANLGHCVSVISRSKLKVKQFDIPPVWMSPLRNSEFSKFYSLSIPERYQLIQAVRDGGSITPDAYQKFLLAVKNNQITFYENAEVVNVEDKNGDLYVHMNTCDGHVESFDSVVLGTGERFSIDEIPLLGDFKKDHPIDTFKELPKLTTNLQWSDEIPLYLMGAYTSLEVGPDALNLMGGQVSASRIAPNLSSNECAEDSEEEHETPHHSLTSIHLCNRFSGLI